MAGLLLLGFLLVLILALAQSKRTGRPARTRWSDDGLVVIDQDDEPRHFRVIDPGIGSDVTTSGDHSESDFHEFFAGGGGSSGGGGATGDWGTSSGHGGAGGISGDGGGSDAGGGGD